MQMYFNKICKEIDNFVILFNKKISKFCVKRINTSFVADIYVNYYGKNIKLSSISKINVEDNSIKISLFDITFLSKLEKQISLMKLDFIIFRKKNNLLIKVPPLTQERRNRMLLLLKKELEYAKIFIRNKRQDLNKKKIYFVKEKLISLDEKKLWDKEIQKIISIYISKIEKLFSSKEKEILNK